MRALAVAAALGAISALTLPRFVLAGLLLALIPVLTVACIREVLSPTEGNQ